MDTIKINKKNVKMVAHRGVCGIERENTVPSFLFACSRSYFGVETDVRITKDNHFALLHDNDLSRITDGKYTKSLEESTLAELREIVLPDTDGSKIRQDIRIPTLAEYVHICKKFGKKCILEIKPEFTEEQTLAMLDEIRAIGYLENMIFITYHLSVLQVIGRETDCKMQILTMQEPTDDLLNVCAENGIDLDIYGRVLTKEWVDKFQAKGLEVNVWTINEEEDANKFIEMGVDYITTNILE